MIDRDKKGLVIWGRGDGRRKRIGGLAKGSGKDISGLILEF